MTVVFKTPYADWQALFNDLLPAHVMEQAGWDPGCSTVDPAIDLSGGPFEISSVTANQIVLARNPKWWGQAPYLDRFVIRIADSPTQLTNWVTSGKVEVVAPTSYGQDFLEQVSGDPTLDSNSSVSSSFLQLEFSTTSPVTATVGVREGIAHAVDRQTLVDAVVGWDNTGIVPSASHLYSQSQGTYPSPRTPALQFSGQPGYTPPATSATPTPAQPFPSTDDPSITDDDLTDAGYVRGPTGAWELPTGAPLTVKVAIDEGDAWAAQTGTLLVQQLQTAGIGTTTVLADSTAAGRDGPRHRRRRRGRPAVHIDAVPDAGDRLVHAAARPAGPRRLRELVELRRPDAELAAHQGRPAAQPEHRQPALHTGRRPAVEADGRPAALRRAVRDGLVRVHVWRRSEPERRQTCCGSPRTGRVRVPPTSPNTVPGSS